MSAHFLFPEEKAVYSPCKHTAVPCRAVPCWTYQAEERSTEREGHHPAAARAISAPSPGHHLHSVGVRRFRRPLDRLQRTLEPSPGVLPLVKQGVLLLVVVVVVVLHAGETNVLLFDDGVSRG